MRRLGAVTTAGVLMTALAACASAPVHPYSPGTSDPGWYRLADFPLEPRQGSVLAWTGTEVLVFGGSEGPPCPPNADCVAMEGLRDGAAFDPATGTWRVLADAPVGLWLSPSAFADGQVFVSAFAEGEASLISYDVEQDAWREWDAPFDIPQTPVADGDRIVFASGSDENGVEPDYILDPAAEEWSVLPEDPIGPAFDRSVTATPEGLVLTAKELVPSPGSEVPALTLVALFDRDSGTWGRLPDTEQIGGWQWAVHGGRMVAPELGGADGGEVGNWGREYPFGGVISLPDGTWSPLADPPAVQYIDWIPMVVGQRFSISSGYVYDDAKQSWTPVPRPADAPEQFGSAIWVDDRLFVLGGVDWADGDEQSPGAWLYVPEP